jgi:hypothetical protein
LLGLRRFVVHQNFGQRLMKLRNTFPRAHIPRLLRQNGFRDPDSAANLDRGLGWTPHRAQHLPGALANIGPHPVLVAAAKRPFRRNSDSS